ncbi:retroviral-like aspartic protease family protein [Roseateles noduli]|uniref:retroviral-like aspartic protease family protein n=1 Tax=Roseateles noduli TaxID=2052484 RepID=UPI003D65DA13
MNARRLAPLLALILAATGAAAAEEPGKARCGIEAMNIPVRLVDHRPVATVQLNGVEVPMLVDSGAFYSMMSAATAAQLNLKLRRPPPNFTIQGHAGSVESLRVTTVDEVGLQLATLKKVDFFVGGNELNAGIMGILGRNFLSAADTEYDLAHGMLRLVFPKGDCEKANLAYWAGDAPVIEAPIETNGRRNDTAVRVLTKINGERVTALMDTGAPGTSLSLKAARRAGIKDADMKPFGRASGIGSGYAERWIADVETFELAGEKITRNRLPIADVDTYDHGMLLGLDYFLSHRVYVSRLQGKVYATWNGGPVFAQGRADATQYDQRYAAKAEEIAADDADGLLRRGAAALAAGDPKRALEDLNRACELKPEVAGCFDARSRVHQAMKQPKLALADLDTALTLDPSLAEARLRRVPLRVAAGDRDGAKADLAALDATLPAASNLRVTMAEFHARFNQVPDALRQYELWIKSHPNDLRLAEAYNGRCWLRARMNVDVAQGLDDCKEAVDLDGDTPAYRDSLGWTYLRLGDASRAKKAFDKTIELRSWAWPLYGRGLAQLKLNEAEKGRQDLEAARKLMPTIDEAVKKAGFDALAEAVH